MKTTHKQVKSGGIDWRPRGADARSVQRRIAKLRQERPAAEEIAAIATGSKEFHEGRFVDLSQLHDELDRRRRQL